MRISQKRSLAVFFGFVAGAFLLSPVAGANLKEMKAYKEAFPEAKLKCINCHAVEHPSKDGSHGLNAYGQAALTAEANPTAAVFKKLGKTEDFKGK